MAQLPYYRTKESNKSFVMYFHGFEVEGILLSEACFSVLWSVWGLLVINTYGILTYDCGVYH